MVFPYLVSSAGFALCNQSTTILLMQSWSVKTVSTWNLTLFYEENILNILSKFQSIILNFEQDNNLPPKNPYGTETAVLSK